MRIAGRCFLVLAVVPSLGMPLQAGWRVPQGLGYLLGSSQAVAVYEIESVQADKRVITFKKVEDVPAKLSGRFRLYVPREGEREHRSPPGQEASEWFLRWARPGSRVMSFNHQEVYVGGYWFQMFPVKEGQTPDFKLSEWHALFGYSFAGSIDELTMACREVLAGKETVVPVFASTPFVRDTVLTSHWRDRFEELPLIRLKAGPKLTRVPEARLRDHGNRNEEMWQLIVGPGSGRTGELPALLGQLGEGSPVVRARAARQIGGIGPGGKDALPRLAPLLVDREAAVRTTAAGAMLQLDPKHAAARAVLWKSLEDDTPAVRRSAVEWLWILDRDVEGTIPALVQRQRDTDASVAETATQAIKSFLTAYDLKGLTTDDLRAASQSPDRECARVAAHELARELRQRNRPGKR